MKSKVKINYKYIVSYKETPDSKAKQVYVYGNENTSQEDIEKKISEQLPSHVVVNVLSITKITEDEEIKDQENQDFIDDDSEYDD